MRNKIFYTAKEAQSRLGINANKFNYLVRQGKIKRVILPGQKLGVYPITEIDKMATQVDTALNLYDPSLVNVETATFEDIEDIVDISITVFNGVTSSVEKVRTWLKQCPESIHVLKTNNNTIVGHVIMLPMPEKRIIEILSKKISIDDVSVQEIENFQPDTPLNIYMREIAILPSRDKNTEATWGSTLIAGVVSFIERLGSRHIQLENLYALATTRSGRRTCQVLGFDRLPIIPDPNKPNKVAFGLNVQKSSTIFARHYRDNFQKADAEQYERAKVKQMDNQLVKAAKERTKKKVV